MLGNSDLRTNETLPDGPIQRTIHWWSQCVLAVNAKKNRSANICNELAFRFSSVSLLKRIAANSICRGRWLNRVHQQQPLDDSASAPNLIFTKLIDLNEFTYRSRCSCDAVPFIRTHLPVGRMQSGGLMRKEFTKSKKKNTFKLFVPTITENYRKYLSYGAHTCRDVSAHACTGSHAHFVQRRWRRRRWRKYGQLYFVILHEISFCECFFRIMLRRDLLISNGEISWNGFSVYRKLAACHFSGRAHALSLLSSSNLEHCSPFSCHLLSSERVRHVNSVENVGAHARRTVFRGYMVYIAM